MSAVASFSSLAASPLFLRRVLWLDAATGAATGALQLLLAGFLAGLLGLPETLLVVSGWVMFVYVAGIGFIATRQFVPAALVWLLIGANFLWVLGCLALLLGDLVMPTLAGKVFIAIQAVTVGLLAELQWVGLRKAVVRPGW
ncbi:MULTISPECIES: hypothetical protein [unclassified Polaromonas]|uniref:hypothetical protein n=1 Tax=unclassified Polaromonas TaxID=2638319 RepID=UPI000BC897D0|nr:MULTISPECIES: hypothetical protein [unclassified Polaromonas]OYY36585.1 MAG: hypothetical protein B7Y60_10435 [Polaromonas sp. 35-63-35]OYZ22822.1 MAG: hypothetical protein B7Y28_02585 [Polaromonas sp. 16-63-31]OYZ80966.1 MAG: hypothetical protein B7Y09_00565 [Polaromonas sp. 24-63-21]OZA52816.1 MAG: hypothetical protein B7X88_02580 [Polaromonas sp. 17-63-33]OZA88331.1 MAG: hypothetical protein B7X65_07040 [Polaromonas sp. 39-63-25]